MPFLASRLTPLEAGALRTTRHLTRKADFKFGTDSDYYGASVAELARLAIASDVATEARGNFMFSRFTANRSVKLEPPRGSQAQAAFQTLAKFAREQLGSCHGHGLGNVLNLKRGCRGQ